MSDATPTQPEAAPNLPAKPIAAELAVDPRALPPDRHPAAVYLAKLAPSGRRTMRGALANIAHFLVGDCGVPASRCACIAALPWHLLRYQHTAAIRAALAERHTPKGANKHLSALKGTLKEAWRLGLVPADDYARAVDLPQVRGSTLPAGRALSDGEIRSLFAACARDENPAGARDAALFGILIGGGLRREEAAGLELADYDAEEAGLVVRAGKGRKDRRVFLPAGAVEALQAWLAVRGAEPGPLFHPIRRTGAIQRRRLSAQAILYTCVKRGREAGVAHFSPHDMRRTLVSSMLDAGVDLSVVQQVAGHSNPATTARYDRRPEGVKKKAAGMLAIPYVRRCRRSP
jgi:integrase